MKKGMKFLGVIVLLVSSLSYSQISNTVVKAKIETEEIEGSIKITGTAENLSEIVQSLSYKLSVIKKNNINNNQSNNAQEGLFSLEPSENKKLSVTQVNVGKDDEVIVLLLFYDENKQLIGKDRIVLGTEKKVESLPIDGFELKGIVIDETKTKVGKDFYDLYYYKYNEYKINAPNIVSISEELSFARNTKLVISMNNETIYEFMAKPDEEYLNNMVQKSIYATYSYLKNLEKENKYFTQY
ncbi:CsgE family curli-type amyloid fiber assembly protein [Flavobacterium sp. WC2416]|uniref:Curli production assembly/transport component CsgE n=1 Tax=Flavobacterium sp. WC2416 TaxID=3234141 RepID=A0AB39WES9_9FLAO